MKAINTPGMKGFLEYFKAAQPAIYGEFVKRYKGDQGIPGLNGLGIDVALTDPINSTPATAASSGWASAVGNVLTGAAQIYLTKQNIDLQKSLIQTQLTRAQQGLPPLNIDPYQYGIQPTVNVGMSSSTQKMLMYGAIGLAAVFLLPKLLGSRR